MSSLSYPMDCSPPGSSVRGSFQARVLEWVAIAVSKTDATEIYREHQFSSVQLLSPVQLFATPWIAARKTSLSIANSRSLLKFMSIKPVMPSNHLILCCPLLLLPSILPSTRVLFPMSQFFASGGQSIGVSASASVLPMNIQD